MKPRETVFFTAVLILLGAGWGFTQPMTKIAVSTGHQHFGLIFWQLVIGSGLMVAICALLRLPLSLAPRHLRFYLALAFIGTLLPNSLSYSAAVHLPAGVISILLSMIPMLAFPMALGLGLDRFELRRLAGLLIGLIAVLLIVAPGAQMQAALPMIWVVAIIVVCACYAFEGNFVARWGMQGLHPLQAMMGTSVLGAIIALPLALGTGQWISPLRTFEAPEWALIASSMIHVLVYATYVWLVGRAGPTFTVQVSYLVTLFGVIWARIFLDESYSTAIWISLVLMMLGMYLVQPRAVLSDKERVAER